MEDLNNASFDNIYSIDYNKDFKGYFEKIKQSDKITEE